jgi:hypothetical protein
MACSSFAVRVPVVALMSGVCRETAHARPAPHVLHVMRRLGVGPEGGRRGLPQVHAQPESYGKSGCARARTATARRGKPHQPIKRRLTESERMREKQMRAAAVSHANKGHCPECR